MSESQPSDLYGVVFDYLVQSGLTKTLKRFKKETGTEGGNSGHNLIEIYDFYLKHNQPEKKKKKKRKHKEPEETEVTEETVEEEVSTPSKESINTPESNKKAKVETSLVSTNGGGSKQNTPYRRVTEDDARLLQGDKSDNTYWSKGGDLYGMKANEILEKVHGKDFRKEKNKKKKGTYKGGPIERGVRSIKFEYSDEE